MKSKITFAAALAAGVSLALPTQAHHAVNASVDITQHVNAEAVLKKIDWINPHTWLHFDVVQPDGSVVRNVAIESLGINAFRRVGFASKDAFAVGSVYKIEYYPNRNGTPGGYMTKMTFPDGRSYESKNEDPTAVAPTQ
jgi:hypothetical protein